MVAKSPDEAEQRAQEICCEDNDYEPGTEPLLIAGVIECENGKVPKLVDHDPVFSD